MVIPHPKSSSSIKADHVLNLAAAELTMKIQAELGESPLDWDLATSQHMDALYQASIVEVAQKHGITPEEFSVRLFPVPNPDSRSFNLIQRGERREITEFLSNILPDQGTGSTLGLLGEYVLGELLRRAALPVLRDITILEHQLDAQGKTATTRAFGELDIILGHANQPFIPLLVVEVKLECPGEKSVQLRQSGIKAKINRHLDILQDLGHPCRGVIIRFESQIHEDRIFSPLPEVIDSLSSHYAQLLSGAETQTHQNILEFWVASEELFALACDQQILNRESVTLFLERCRDEKVAHQWRQQRSEGSGRGGMPNF